jgi:putative addiction module component (TIGR02574 family)
MAKLEIDISKLTPEERLDLIEELWESLSTDPARETLRPS